MPITIAPSNTISAVNQTSQFRLFLLGSYLVNLLFCLAMSQKATLSGIGEIGFRSAMCLTYAAIYLLPTLIMTALVRTISLKFSYILTPLFSAATHIVLLVNAFVFNGFNFHLNGFVINLLTTPGGIAAMGMDNATQLVFISMMAGMVLLNALIWLGAGLYAPYINTTYLKKTLRISLIVLFVISLGERLAFGIARINANPTIPAIARTLPAYQPTSIRSLAKHFGVEVARQPKNKLKAVQGNLRYPLQPLTTVSPPTKPLNLVILACESWRADTLTAEIMPAMNRFADQAQRFTSHYSGGNGTRMGIFSLFYGLPGSYWFNLLENRTPPVLMQHLKAVNYAFHLSTSAAFSYPEFDKTVFAGMQDRDLHVESGGEGWERDRRAVNRIIQWLDQRDTEQPFMLFHFFESGHASYYFPPESVIRRDYLDDFNYATVDVKKNIDKIHNRYVNSIHHLDSQLARVVDALRERNLLDSTLIVITGDHGEEFMEKGYWGHNSQFTEEQIRVPMIVHWPGKSPATHDYMTSHGDLAATLLPALGVTNPLRDYTTGTDLFSEKGRSFITISDWDRIAIRTAEYKAVFPLGVSEQMDSDFHHADDSPTTIEENAVQAQLQPVMGSLLEAMSRFRQ